MNKDANEYREIRELIINDLKEHNNIISKIYSDQNLTDNITNAILLIKECLQNGGKLIFIGNGGSASQSEHLAAEFIGIKKSAISLTSNSSVLTAISNDYGYENSFSWQIDSLSNDKDLLIALSTSGDSKNVVNAIIFAQQKKDMKVIAMTGKSGGSIKNNISNKDNILIQIKSDDTVRIQECHLTIGHIIFEAIKKSFRRNLFE